MNYATFSGDGSMVLSVGYDGAGRLWSNNKSGRTLSPALAHGGEGGELDSVYWAAFAPPPPPARGVYRAKPRPPLLAVTGGRDGTARLWDLTPDSRPLEDIKKHAELLARHHIDDTESYRRVSVDQLIKRWDYLRGNYPQHFKPNPPRPDDRARRRRWRHRRRRRIRGDPALPGELPGGELLGATGSLLPVPGLPNGARAGSRPWHPAWCLAAEDRRTSYNSA